MLTMTHDETKSYPIYFGHRFFETELLKYLDSSAFFLCIDESVNRYYSTELTALKQNAQGFIVLEASEDKKTAKTVERIHLMMLEAGATRASKLVAIGGGIVGDVVGYAASIFMRGIDFIQVPTTLLAQVDSSVGGKVAINQFAIKNIIGSFHTPVLVLIDTYFLSTLTDRAFKSGLVELIKHGLIADRTLFEQLDSYPNLLSLREDSENLGKLIRSSVAVKKSIVETDFFDTGERQKLNFGHTFGHALEMSPGSDVTHGEAVAIGILVATKLSQLSQAEKERITQLFEKFECIKPLPAFDETKMLFDKKRMPDRITEILLTAIGKATLITFDIEKLQQEFMKSYAQLRKESLHLSHHQFKISPVKLSGEVVMPPSKSSVHRYLLAAHLSGERVLLTGVNSLCEDVKVSMSVLSQLGTTCTWDEQSAEIFVQPTGICDSNPQFSMGESGTTLRMFLPALIHQVENFAITGSGKLPRRSLQVYFDQLSQVTFDKKGVDNLPLHVSGKLMPRHYELDGSESSQFISGLLYVLPLLDAESTITFSKPLVSMPYVQMTVNTLADFGVDIHMENFPTEILIPGNQQYRPQMQSFAIEQDYSARAFWEVASQLGEHDIDILPPASSTLQGDAIICEIIREKITTFDLKNAPDLGPILAVLFSKTGGVLTGISRLVDKESNRLEAITNFLTTMGVPFKIEGDQLEIWQASLEGGKFLTHNDHRITMSLIIAASVAKGTFVIEEIKSIDKSYPDFIWDFEHLGGNINEQ